MASSLWGYPVAQAVIDYLALVVWRGVSRAEVWMVQAPADVQQCVWDVVVLTAASTEGSL